jgi:hypothetical protein
MACGEPAAVKVVVVQVAVAFPVLVLYDDIVLLQPLIGVLEPSI